MTSILARDQSAQESQVIGNQLVSCDSETNCQAVVLYSASNLMLQHTNILGSDLFMVECDSTMHSDTDIQTAVTNLVTKAFASASVTMQLQSDVPFQFEVVISNQPPDALPYQGFLAIRTSSSQPILGLNWNSTTGSMPQAFGILPAGGYQVEFWSATQAEGYLGPTMQNSINGSSGTVMSLTLTPQSPATTPTPVLRLKHESGERVLLEMTSLQPGTHYFVERNEELVPGLWPIIANFIAAGTNAIWADTINHQVPEMFYRLRY